VFARNSSKNSQRETHEKPNRNNQEDGGEGNGGGDLVVRSDAVDE